jgi:predicted lysophospholipase L1 biosynthesis ABC-type transport system permease subunit
MEVDTDRPDVYVVLAAHDEQWQRETFRTLPTIVVRPMGPAPGLAERLRQAAHAVGPPVIVEHIRPGSDWFGDNLKDTRNRAILLGLIGGLGLVLTLVGIFSITAYAVARRTHEVGVRMAFGATPSNIVARMVKDAAWPVAGGIVAGLGATYYASRFIESFLYDTPPREPVTLALVALAMGVVALLAAWIPSRRAAKVDPVVALRAE